MCVLLCAIMNANAQLRKLRADEIKFYNSLYPVLYSALPHEFRDWKVIGDGPDFDAIKYFCPDSEGPDCIGKCAVSVGVKDPYQLGYAMEYTMPGDQADGIKGGTAGGITDYNNAQQVAAALKGAAKIRVQVYITVNSYSPGSGVFTIVNCPKAPAQTLGVPVPTTLAIMGIRSPECPYMQDGHVNLSPGGDGYYDNALVFMGKPVAFKQNQSYSDGYTHTSYGVGFDKTKIGTLIVQNIVITFKGDAEDIKDVIKQIDWQKLNALLAK